MIHFLNIATPAASVVVTPKTLSARYITKLILAQSQNTFALPLNVTIADRAGGQFFPYNTGDQFVQAANIPLVIDFNQPIQLYSDPAEIVITTNNTGGSANNLLVLVEVTDNPRRELEELLNVMDQILTELCKLTKPTAPGK